MILAASRQSMGHHLRCATVVTRMPKVAGGGIFAPNGSQGRASTNRQQVADYARVDQVVSVRRLLARASFGSLLVSAASLLTVSRPCRATGRHRCDRMPDLGLSCRNGFRPAGGAVVPLVGVTLNGGPLPWGLGTIAAEITRLPGKNGRGAVPAHCRHGASTWSRLARSSARREAPCPQSNSIFECHRSVASAAKHLPPLSLARWARPVVTAGSERQKRGAGHATQGFEVGRSASSAAGTLPAEAGDRSTAGSLCRGHCCRSGRGRLCRRGSTRSQPGYRNATPHSPGCRATTAERRPRPRGNAGRHDPPPGAFRARGPARP
jgi:hypothetical protein